MKSMTLSLLLALSSMMIVETLGGEPTVSYWNKGGECNLKGCSSVTVTGIPGFPGLPGMIGAAGEKGEAGADGHKGDTGATGSLGDKGARGPRGPVGAPGSIGLSGLQGPMGPGISHLLKGRKQCSSEAEGLLRYHHISNWVQSCDGTNWLPLLLLEPGTSPQRPASSCREVAMTYRSAHKNGKYWIKPSSTEPAFQVYCDAVEGWTLIMKIDGGKDTFKYDSSLWSNKETFQSNYLALDSTEAKLASYWTLPFTELRLGMHASNTSNWITIGYSASSLYSLIADGQYRATSIGESRWRSLLSTSSLQRHCNKEGFNAKGVDPYHIDLTCRARIGILANQENDCGTPDSSLGFGTSYRHFGFTTSAGNFAVHGGDNGDVHVMAIGYVMAR